MLREKKNSDFISPWTNNRKDAASRESPDFGSSNYLCDWLLSRNPEPAQMTAPV
jgi:hypothetical protein